MVSACLRIPVRSSFALAMVVFLFVAVPVQAQIESSGFPVLQLDASARTAALGGASSALLESNSTALFSNPALLSPSAHKSLSFSYLNHLSDINAGWLSYARNVDSLGTLAVGVRYVSFGSFDETDERGEKIGTFGASDVALTVGGARTWRTNWRVGVGVNLMRSSIASNAATAASLDGGLVFAKPGSLSSFSASAHNLGLVFSSIGQRSDSLPLDLRLGFTHKLAHLPLLVSVTAYRLHKLDG